MWQMYCQRIVGFVSSIFFIGDDDKRRLTATNHSYGTVYKCLYHGKEAALKMFRNTTRANAINEIEIMFILRHPNIIGLYAWFLKRGNRDQYGWVVLFI